MTGRPRVLVFSTLLPLPVDRGDRNRLFHLLELLASVASVRLVAVEREWEPRVDDLRPLGDIEVRRVRVTARAVTAAGVRAVLSGRPYLITRYALPRIRRFVRAQVEEFRPDVFWGYQAATFPFLPDAGGARRIVDLVDSPSRYVSLVTGTSDVPALARLAMAVQWRIAGYERRAIAAMDVALVNSEADAAYVRQLTGREHGVVLLDNCIPRALMRDPWSPADRPPTLLFVGNLAYVPNAAAVRLLLAEILPRVRRRIPDVRAVVCGARGEALAREFAGAAGVEFRGFVDDLAPVYRAASVMLVPVPLAGGTQYKLLESMAVGLPAVVSAVSAAITGIRHEEHVLVGETPDEYAEASCRLLTDPALAARLSAAGRRFVEARHTWESKRPMIEALVAGEAGVSRRRSPGSDTQ